MPLHLDIVTPEKKVFSAPVESIYLPGADGEMGVLPMHAGLITALQPGVLRYSHDGTESELAIGSGFAEISQTLVTVLTDSALGEDQIDEEQTEVAIKRAEEKLATIDHSMDAEEVAYLEGLISRQAAALKFKRRHQQH
ncbi:MAG: ATP synthase F1 subunit epsilon [Luteolibacter sp.]|jgi:F-type H+-transporting ATPase subunit epsilon